MQGEGTFPLNENTCPPWCVTEHGVHLGDEDWLHTSTPLLIDGIMARLCLSINPETGSEDGPYVVIGSTEYTLFEARSLGEALIALANNYQSPAHA
jgi:hypothetical protein